ncbi:mediator of RNA polymerase II transcription subunit 16 [Trichogramma pretiosum]|uniref:mediator of RNA polymerase II transcription subunit 16 n=1 Tax=Trichogramma pretiosum TaxID=7493 RepID=UPI0006C9E3BC|nr:mediator of RNA polymerase II transcription subunit 16 [Trichogramma pretiosum]XP_014225319.1 mediator of RNA polymerase II transcription subunit 16 [Trichogramma pretiosum]
MQQPQQQPPQQQQQQTQQPANCLQMFSMESMYTIKDRSQTKSNLLDDGGHSGSGGISNDDDGALCSLSCRNQLAFTRIVDIDNVGVKSWGYHVYVCDINSPWNAHKVLTNKSKISALKWDLTGEKLAVSDYDGHVQLWTFKDYLRNEWMLVGSHHFAGEHIMGMVWFHNGKKTQLVSEKKDSPQYSEKFTNSPYAPSVKQFGGRAAQGVFVVSNTGMLGAVLINQDAPHATICASESIGITRQRITAVDISYARNGQFLIAISGGSVALPIRCYSVSVRKIDERCSITSQALPSFFVQDNEAQGSTPVITNLKFVSSEKVDTLIVAANNMGCGWIELWELSEKTHTVHKNFQAKTSDIFKTVFWQHQATHRCNHAITAITTTKLPIIPSTSYILVALSDLSIQCFSSDGLKGIAATSLNNHNYYNDPLPKRQKSSSSIACIDMSWLGCAFAIINTSGTIHLYKLFPEITQMTLNHACTLLEYSMITGIDWLDLILCIKTGIESLADRFEASFNRQPIQVQQYYYLQFLCIKSSLYRMLTNGQGKAADLSALNMVHSVATAFKSLLRPSDSFHDKFPSERLTSVLTENIISDVDKVLLHIEPKEFTVEPTTLQSLQQLMQWVADLALNLLVRIPEQRMQLKSSGYELLKDHKALNILRELLVIIRIWGLLRKSCLPTYSRSADNIDVLGLLFQHLSKLVQLGNENQSIDDQLIDDCCLLPNQIMIPMVCPVYSMTAVATPHFFFQNLPLQLEFGVKPDLNFVPELNHIEGCMRYNQVVDVVKHIYLGKKPSTVKQCTRCRGKSQAKITTRTAAIKAWEQRWLRKCPCGGSWEIYTENQ